MMSLWSLIAGASLKNQKKVKEVEPDWRQIEEKVERNGGLSGIQGEAAGESGAGFLACTAKSKENQNEIKYNN